MDKSVEPRRPLPAPANPEPLPVMEGSWSAAAQIAIVGICFILTIVAIEHARPVLLPVVSAFVIGMMLGPVSAAATRAGVPSIISALVLWFLVVATFYGVIMLLSAPIVEWVGKGPQLGLILKEKLNLFNRPLSALHDLRNALFPNATEKEAAVSTVAILQPVMMTLTPAIGQLVIFFGTLFFFLLGRNRIRHGAVALFESRDGRLRMLRILNDIEHQLTGYLSVVAVINLFVGLAAAIIAWMVGLPNPVAWGVLGFILNFVPYLGALLMELLFFAAGLVTFSTLGHALVAPLMYLAFTTVEGHFITPAVMGKRLLLNPLTVFLALVFWTWIWGPIGAFLAVPLVIVALVTFHHLVPREEGVLPD